MAKQSQNCFSRRHLSIAAVAFHDYMLASVVNLAFSIATTAAMLLSLVSATIGSGDSLKKFAPRASLSRSRQGGGGQVQPDPDSKMEKPRLQNGVEDLIIDLKESSEGKNTKASFRNDAPMRKSFVSEKVTSNPSHAHRETGRPLLSSDQLRFLMNLRTHLALPQMESRDYAIAAQFFKNCGYTAAE